VQGTGGGAYSSEKRPDATPTIPHAAVERVVAEAAGDNAAAEMLAWNVRHNQERYGGWWPRESSKLKTDKRQ
jgi:hypothetical protein